MLPGIHRIALQQGQIQLTVWIGDVPSLLRQQSLQAHAVLADALCLAHTDESEATHWSQSLKSLTRHCHQGATFSLLHLQPEDAEPLRRQLRGAGLALLDDAAPPLTERWLHTRYAPQWTPRQRSSTLPAPVPKAGHALVIGAGLAGSATAFSLAQRGWLVTVLSAGSAPADGASGLPAGLFCPHVSPDDSVLSRLTRNGVRMTMQRLQALSVHGQDWSHTGVLEHNPEGSTGLPPTFACEAGQQWTRPASTEQLHTAHLPASAPAYWHSAAGWVRPAQWVQAQLQHPAITWRGSSAIQTLQPITTPDGDTSWQAISSNGNVITQADIVVLAAGPASEKLLPEGVHWPLQHIRGQVTTGAHQPGDEANVPAFPANGSGNLVPYVPGLPTAPMTGTKADTGNALEGWVMGSTFERDVTALPVSPAEQAAAHATNLDKLRTLLPASAAQLADGFDGRTSTWANVRLTTRDRLPLVGPVSPQHPGLWACTAMGARGLTLSVLCGELLAAWLHGEPLPLDAKLAQHLSTQRL